MKQYILKLPHYSCEKEQLFFLGKKSQQISKKAASLFRELSYEPRLIKEGDKEAVQELVGIKASVVCQLSEREKKKAPLVLVIAPHLDDAAFSIGGLLTRLAKDCRIHILTLFSLDPYSMYRVLRSDFDWLQEIRTAEETVVANLIGATTYQLKWEDAILRGYSNFSQPITKAEPLEEMEHRLWEAFPQNLALVLCPLGLTHVDHRLTRLLIDRIKVKTSQVDFPVMYYEDLPYACDGFQNPKCYKPYDITLSQEERIHKKKMVSAYISQLSPGLASRMLSYRDGNECIWGPSGWSCESH